MTEAPAEAVPAEPPAQGEPEKPAKPETDWKAEAKKWETRSKENKTAADELAAIKEANQTEAEKTANRLAAAEKDAADARREALRFRIASEFSIAAADAELFLTGDDEATMTAQAKRLTDRESERKKHGNLVPREGNNPQSGSDDERTFARDLFGA